MDPEADLPIPLPKVQMENCMVVALLHRIMMELFFLLNPQQAPLANYMIYNQTPRKARYLPECFFKHQTESFMEYSQMNMVHLEKFFRLITLQIHFLFYLLFRTR